MSYSHLITAAHSVRQAFDAARRLSKPGPNLPVVLIPEAQWPEFVIRAREEIRSYMNMPDGVDHSDHFLTVAGIRFICSDDPRMNSAHPLSLETLEPEWGDDALYSRPANDGSVGGEKHHVPYRRPLIARGNRPRGMHLA